MQRDSKSLSLMHMEKQYKYYAFISYSRKDEKYAKWVQDKLESYKLPSRIAHDNPELKKGIRPVFRDKTDLGAGSLYDNLGKELAASQYLIIISSPSSASSDWVDKETREFLKTHTADHIIPFIVAGTPNSNDENECFNSAIKEIKPEILGVNIQEIGKQQALTKVVAKLLNLSFDALWQRHKRREKRQKMLLGICALILVLGGLFVWDYNRPKYVYYASIAEYADGWLPKGIVKLDDHQVEHRFHSYQFTYRQHKLQEVAVVNSYGRPVEGILKFIHPTRTSIKPVIQHYNLSGEILYMEEFGGLNFDRIDFMYPPEKGGSAFGVRNRRNKVTEVRRHALTRNANGFVIRKEFKRYPGVDAVDASDTQGIFGYEYEVDSVGQVLAQYYIDNEKRRVASKKGMACTRYTYDALGSVIREQYMNIDGHPHFTNFGGAETRRIFDEYGNNICETYYNTNGEPCIAPFYGYAAFKTTYDAHGNKIEQSYHDASDSLCISSNGYAMLQQKFDSRGNCIEIAYFDEKRQPMPDVNGYAKVEQTYDDNGYVIEHAYYGVDGQPCLCDLGYARLTMKYDESGNEIEEAYFGIDGQPCSRELGFAKLILKYDERGNEIEEAYYDIEGRPCLCNNFMCAKMVFIYDDRGKLIEEAYYGIDGKPCLSIDNYAKLTQKFSESGKLIEEVYYDVAGNICPCQYGYAKVTCEYDERGNELSETFWGKNGKRCNATYSYTRFPDMIDNTGFTDYARYVSCNGQMLPLENGYSKFEGKYDPQTNQLIEVVYYDDRDNVLLVIHDPVVRRL